jgi:outer membrane protein TolC
MTMKRYVPAALLLVCTSSMAGLTLCAQTAPSKQLPKGEALPQPRPLPPEEGTKVAQPEVTTIDLASALRLAGIENPEILMARQRVTLAAALQQQAAAFVLPSLNAGLNYDGHQGSLQQSSGNVININRGALYVGAGANAVAAGTVSIPGVQYNFNVSNAIFNFLASRQVVQQRRFAAQAMQNEGLRLVTQAYNDLLREEARRAAAYQTLSEADVVFRLAQERLKAQDEKEADAKRAETERTMRAIDLIEAEQFVLRSSARLASLLNLDPKTRLHPAEDRLVPMPVVPEIMPLNQLLAVAVVQRPEVGEKRAAIQEAMLHLRNARLLPFSPDFIVGFSAGTMGGGSNLIAGSAEPRFGAPVNQDRFGNFGQRNDFDVIAFWTFKNMGTGNFFMTREMRSKLTTAELEQLAELNRIRAEVANAFIRVNMNFSRIVAAQKSIEAGLKAYSKDLDRIRNRIKGALAIELLTSLQLLGQARNKYLDAIVDFNQAQIDLYVALGQPPADTLARQVPRDFTPVGRPKDAKQK